MDLICLFRGDHTTKRPAKIREALKLPLLSELSNRETDQGRCAASILDIKTILQLTRAHEGRLLAKNPI